MSDAPRALRLLSLAAHELRTPVGVIGGCLSMAQGVGTDLGRRDRALAQASRNYERVVELLAEMSDLWRLEAGEAVFNRGPLKPDTALRNAIRDLTPKLPEGVTVDLDVASLGPLRVMADAVRLERALTAIVLAVARHAVGRVAVVARPVAEAARVQIVVGHDPGPDWPPPEGSARVPPDEFESGLGLSLPIARRVLEADGGSLHAVPSPGAYQLIAELAAAP